MSRYSKLGKNFGLLTIGSFASSLLSFLFVPLYTAVLSTEEYGVSDLISVTISLLYPVLTLVISEAIMRFSLDVQNDSRQIFSIGICITSVGCMIMLVLSPILKWTPLADYCFYFISYFIVQSFYTVLAQYTKGQEHVKEYAIGGLINSVTVIVSNILLLLVIKIGIHGYLISLILGHLITSIYYCFVNKVWKCLIPFTRIEKALLTAMLAYSCPMILNSVSWWISNSSDKYILSYFRGVSENGIYAVAYKIPSMLAVITGLFINAWQISAVEDFNSDQSRKFYSSVCEKYIGLNVIISGGLIAVSRILAKILFAPEYYGAWKITPILIIAYIFNTLSSFYGTIYTSAKKTKMLFYSTVLAAMMNIVLNIVLIPKWGGIGAAVATLASYALIWLIRVVDSSKIMELRINWKLVFLDFLILFLEVVILRFGSIVSDAVCVMLAILICGFNYRVFKDIISVLKEKILSGRR